jgi:pyruvate dehydrogenase E2 component (dihydrolipoamide acetyltransferase)
MAPATVRADGERIDISPVSRKIAEEHMISIGIVVGTGPGGRIIKKDIEKEIAVKKKVSESLKRVSETSTIVEIPFSGTGQIIANRLTQSKQTIPHFYLFKDVDMTDALAWRKAYNQKTQTRISVNDMIVKATASALAEFPRLNAHVAKDKLILHKDINIGLAISTDEGVLVPVIPNVDKKDIQEISLLTLETIKCAKNGISKYPSVGTFTISNLTMYFINSFLPIINPPECAILGVGSIEKRAIPIKNNIGIRNVMTLTLACDHRAVDGVYGSGFLKVVKRYLEKFPL